MGKKRPRNRIWNAKKWNHRNRAKSFLTNQMRFKVQKIQAWFFIVYNPNWSFRWEIWRLFCFRLRKQWRERKLCKVSGPTTDERRIHTHTGTQPDWFWPIQRITKWMGFYRPTIWLEFFVIPIRCCWHGKTEVEINFLAKWLNIIRLMQIVHPLN